MIQITYAQLRNPDFDKVVGRLKKSEGLRPKLAYNVGRIISALQSEFKTAVDLNQKIIADYLLVDDKGEPVLENGNPQLDKTKDMKALESKIAEYHSITFTIDRHKLTLNDLEQVTPPLTPAEVMALEPLLDTEAV